MRMCASLLRRRSSRQASRRESGNKRRNQKDLYIHYHTHGCVWRSFAITTYLESSRATSDCVGRKNEQDESWWSSLSVMPLPKALVNF